MVARLNEEGGQEQARNSGVSDAGLQPGTRGLPRGDFTGHPGIGQPAGSGDAAGPHDTCDWGGEGLRANNIKT